MKAYIAGKLSDSGERASLEEIEQLCRELGFETFLPHRDAGIVEGMHDVERVFKADITNSLASSDIVVARLDGFHIGAGTAWELGYAYAEGIPSVGIKTDESIEEALDYLSPMLIGSMPIVKDISELKTFLMRFQQMNQTDL